MFIAVSVKRKNKLIESSGEKVEGSIENIVYENRKGKIYKYPIVRFITKEQQRIVKRSDENVVSGFKKGGKVLVFYDPADPNKFQIQSFKYNQFYFTILLGSIVFTIAGIMLALNEAGVIHWFK